MQRGDVTCHMRTMRCVALVAALLGGPSYAADAQCITPPVSANIPPRCGDANTGTAPPPVFVGPGDLVAGNTGWWGLRAFNAAVAAPGTQAAVRLRRASDSTQQDILILTSGSLDVATAGTFCAATSCFVVTLYDQSGLGNNLTQATAANQPAFVFSCIGALPCFQTTVNTQRLNGPNTITPSGGPVSISVTFNRVISTSGACVMIQQNGNAGNRISNGASASTVQLRGTGSLTAPATDAIWNAANGVANGASSVLQINGAETTGTVTVVTTAAVPSAFGAISTTCNATELGVWDNVAFAAGARTALNGNQRSYWGF